MAINDVKCHTMLFYVMLGIKFIVSPYESDAQLTHLSKTNLIDVVISEDRLAGIHYIIPYTVKFYINLLLKNKLRKLY